MRGRGSCCIILFALFLNALAAQPLYAFGPRAPNRRLEVSGSQARTYPYNMIGRLVSSSGGVESQCTAVRVSRRVILTAAHCFYEFSTDLTDGVRQGDPTGGWHEFEDPNGGYVHVLSWKTGTRYVIGTDTRTDLNAGKDWAVALLDDTIDLQSRYLELAPQGLVLNAGTALSAAGFSSDMGDGLSLTVDPACAVLSAFPMLQTNCQFWKGASGGPDLIRDSSGKSFVVGIHSFIRESTPPVSYSIPIDVFRDAFAQLLKTSGD